MAIYLTSFLEPANGNSFYLLEDTYFKGGLRVIPDITTVDTYLNPLCKKAGMVVVDQTKAFFQLQDDLVTWVRVDFGLTYEDHGDVVQQTDINPDINVHYINQTIDSVIYTITPPLYDLTESKIYIQNGMGEGVVRYLFEFTKNTDLGGAQSDFVIWTNSSNMVRDVYSNFVSGLTIITVSTPNRGGTWLCSRFL